MKKNLKTGKKSKITLNLYLKRTETTGFTNEQ